MHEERVVVFAGGGTGGHLYPAFAMADALVAECPEVRPFFVGAERGIEARVLPERGLPHLLVPLRGFARGRLSANLALVPRLAESFVRTAELFQSIRPEMVVLTGGYAAVSAGAVAVTRGLPLVLLEPNAWPGMVTRLMAPFADQVHVAYPEVIGRLRGLSAGAARISGHALRPLPETDPATEAAARSALGLAADSDVVLVTGGSQGSMAINRLLTAAARAVATGELPAPQDWQMVWATGPKNHEAVLSELGEAARADWLRCLPYIDDMPTLLGFADLAVGRSGAGTTAELQLSGTPSVLIPLPTSAEGHQEHNARALEAAGAAVLMLQEQATPEEFWDTLSRLMSDPRRREAMSRAARERARPAATAAIGRDLAKLLDCGDRAGRGATSPGAEVHP